MSEPGATHALVRTPIAPVRAEPNVRAELVSQELLGSAVQLLTRQGEWARVAGADGYEGWVNAGGLIACSADAAAAWWDELGARPAISLDALLIAHDGSTLVRLPWGARVATGHRDVLLPDKRHGRLAEGELVAWDQLGTRFAASGPAVIDTALRWTGAPYLWGGRTRWGADCSGFAQAVYRLHGFQLPRDSYQQAEYGERVEPGSNCRNARPGDLVFFRADDSDRIVHVAFSMGGAAILHSALANGQVQSDVLGEGGLGVELAGRVAGVRRFYGTGD